MDVTEAPVKRRSSRWNSPFWHRTGICLWILTIALTVVFCLYPIKFNLLRYATIGGFAVTWAGALFLFWRLRLVRYLALTVAAIVLLICVLPGRPLSPDVLRSEYTRSLTRYTGVTYLWGGESSLGIDCSGLIRRGLMDAELKIGLQTLNPQALRDAFLLYWHDCTAYQLGQGYRNQTRLVTVTPALNTVDPTLLRPGDMAVTGGGSHILAYLGAGEWIDADPKPWRVERVQVPARKNGWFGIRALVVRWKILDH